ncbi:phosphoenolpyruvate--protein phosphotransferase [Elioraea tepida]|uniref:Phosphoenolpyruvate-protein phosphotransferase n=1 Tax=Elioraea tepida TaxID=2843330 RepID=A0A975TZY4_9PROT|nr:phosphoenolpyruvate--protein phosphotransferase [Elioraea tepida]QXM23687.1 phosphoenolpyruvate--protein phosphotransferase [Elioraea tepida]
MRTDTRPSRKSGGDGQPPAREPRRGPSAAERVLHGLAVSPGIGIGRLATATESTPRIERRELFDHQVAWEIERFDAAVAASRKQLAKLRARLSILPEDANRELEPLLDAYAQMLGNSRLIRGIRRAIAEKRINAEAAVADEAEALAEAMASSGSDDRAARQRRADEVREIGRRLLRNLTATPWRNYATLPDGSVLAAELLTPSDAALLEPARLAGVAAEEGGLEGHTAIMLRALGLPAVLGVAGLMEHATPGTTVVVDGTAGTVTLNPTPATLAAARRALAAYAREKQRLAKLRRLPAVTKDGETVELQANLELPMELPMIAQSGAVGIGLLRTEFLFMNRDDVPDEDVQAEAYAQVVDAMQGDPVTIRVLDWGGEKQIESLVSRGLVPGAGGDNPALGVRGIRLLLKETDLFETQLAAILRAALRGPVRVLLPMVTTPAEVREARDLYDRVARRLRRRGLDLPDPLPPLGIMIETPGAALAADSLALEADFFAIGTNDLAMYTLAVDRAETGASHLYDPLHPAVLRLMQFATEAALRMRMPVSVCGEIAGDPRLTPLLLGLGIRSLSMTSGAVPRVKQAVRSVAIDDCARFARAVMEQSDPARIASLIAEFKARAVG